MTQGNKFAPLSIAAPIQYIASDKPLSINCMPGIKNDITLPVYMLVLVSTSLAVLNLFS